MDLNDWNSKPWKKRILIEKNKCFSFFLWYCTCSWHLIDLNFKMVHIKHACVCKMLLFWPLCPLCSDREYRYPKSESPRANSASSPPQYSPPGELSSRLSLLLLHVYTHLSGKKIRARVEPDISGPEQPLIFSKVSTILKGRILIWWYMDPGGGVWLQMQLHLPQLQGCSKQVGGLGSINSVH